MRGLGELVGRLIEPDMAVVAQPKHLDIHAAHALNHRLVAGALLIAVRLGAVRDIGVVQVDVDILEQVVVHKVIVALVVISGQSSVLVEVHALYLGEIQISVLAALNQALVGADGWR